MIKRTRWSATAAVAISLLACQQAPRSNETASGTGKPTAESASVIAVKAAVEPFEAVTEQAFTAKAGELQILVSKAEASYRAVRPNLTPQQQRDADGHIADLKKAEQQRDLSATALTSVEMYRFLLEAQNRANDPAIRIGLLDYAGFRYNALAQANPVRWSDMAQTVQYAEGEWRALAPSIRDRALSERFANSLKAMTQAADKRDKAAARKAADTELQLVDLLEKQALSNPR